MRTTVLPLPLPSLRLIAAVSFLGLGACATTPGPTPKELDALRAELRAVRDSNARLERRLEKLEASQAVLSARRGAPVAAVPGASAPADAGGDEIPELAVVKLKPRRDPAPALPTRTAIVEPPPEILEALASTRFGRASDGDDGEDAGEQKPSEGAAEVAYQEAVTELRTGNVPGGVARLRAFAEAHPKHTRADNALYLAAVGQLALDEAEDAAELLERLLNRYPAGDAVLEAMLKLAECRLKLNQPKSARALYSDVIANYPGTPAANTAEQRLASLPQL